MGVYINMEMPKEKLVMIVSNDGKCYGSMADYAYKRSPIGTAIEVPDHGRLIDANALARFLLNKYWDSSWISPAVLDRFVSEIANAPTIIPAELEEKT